MPLVLLAAFAGCDTGVSANQGYEPAQPIEFSHSLHAGEYQVDCLYCHFGATRSRHAGIPPIQVCLNCHAKVKPDSPEIKKISAAMETGNPIRWTRVHSLPDFVWFNHRAHVNGGVACRDCHGAVESMVRVSQFSSLAMGWCLDCHRQKLADPANDGSIRPPTDCSGCHY